MRQLALRLLAFAVLALASAAGAGEITRAEVLEIARSYAELRWHASEANVLQGRDRAGVEVSTPSATVAPAPVGFWIVGQENTGMPYKWGGYDSLASFTAGVRAGKAAGDLYNPEKRAKADRAVSDDAVGIDCSGFVSRCWKLPKKYGTAMLPDVCTRLSSPAELLPGDVMNAANGHVVIFVEWLDADKDRARFYEAEPYSKVISSERSTRELAEDGYVPLRYRRIR